MFNRIHSMVVAVSLIVGVCTSAQAQDIILTVKHDGEMQQFDRAALEALGTETFETATIWTDGKQVFEGVSLARLAEKIGAQSGTFLATAINDYTVEIPFSDAMQGGPIIAMTLNGAEMSVRDKGPLWIVYPYDASADFRSEVVFSRSIWQLDRIEVVE